MYISQHLSSSHTIRKARQNKFIVHFLIIKDRHKSQTVNDISKVEVEGVASQSKETALVKHMSERKKNKSKNNNLRSCSESSRPAGQSKSCLQRRQC